MSSDCSPIVESGARRFQFGRRTIIGLILSAMVSVAAIAWWAHVRTDPARAAASFRIGFEHSPPYQEVSGSGQPEGPAIEIVTEAARRRGIALEWVHAPEGPEPNLRSGRVDLWPLIADLPERRQFIHISAPYMTVRFWLVSQDSSGIFSPSDAAGHRVGHPHVSVAVRIARERSPRHAS